MSNPVKERANRVQEFVALDRRRAAGDPPLDLGELSRWQELREALERELGTLPGPAGSQRESLRVPTHLKVQVSFGAAQRLLAVYNLSQGGVFLEAERPLEVGAQVCIAFAASAGSPVELEGRVVWTRAESDGRGPAGMGVQLGPLSEWDRALLAELVEAALLG
ncbi:MAG: PilZ domain-containing protein [Myxococcota bacterium]